jgi:hypothetical protein
LEWLGENGPSTVISDTSMGVRPGRLSTRPPTSSSNRWWCMSGSQETDQVFSLAVPAQTVLDLTLECRFVEQEPPTAGPIAAGATLGQIYGTPLDGSSGGIWVPVGYTVLP